METGPVDQQPQKTMFIETIDVVVTGSGRYVLQDLLDGDCKPDMQLDKTQAAGTAKKYAENLAKLQSLPVSAVEPTD